MSEIQEPPARGRLAQVIATAVAGLQLGNGNK